MNLSRATGHSSILMSTKQTNAYMALWENASCQAEMDTILRTNRVFEITTFAILVRNIWVVNHGQRMICARMNSRIE